MLKKGDWIALLTVWTGAATLFFLLFFQRPPGGQLQIAVDNQIVAVLPLDQDTYYPLSHGTVVIQNGKARMESADCRDQICVHTGWISRNGQTVVCLPNRVVLEVVA